jgi:hypothetical protein
MRKVTDRFKYEIFDEALTGFVEEQKSLPAMRALRRLKFMVLATAWSDFHIWDPGVDDGQAMAWAWEDMIIAFSGYGESWSTGAVMSLWSALPPEKWKDMVGVLNKAKWTACEETSKLVKRRYFQTYRRASVRTPSQGFDLPAIVPVYGPRLREWAVKNGRDPDKTEVQMQLVEKYERMGLVDLGDKPSFTGSEEKEYDPPIMDPEAQATAKRRKRGKPVFTLLPGGGGA